jgi:O-antigen ligase
MPRLAGFVKMGLNYRLQIYEDLYKFHFSNSKIGKAVFSYYRNLNLGYFLLIIILSVIWFIFSILVWDSRSEWKYICIGAPIVFVGLFTSKEPKRFLMILIILSLPIDFGYHLIIREYGTLSGPSAIYISITFIFALGIFFFGMLELAGKNDDDVKSFSSTTIPAILFILACILSMVNTTDMFLSVCGIIHYAKGFFIYFITANMLRNEDDVRLVVKVLLVVLILGSLVYITQNFFRIGLSQGDEILFRAKGTMQSPSVTATFFSSVLLIGLGVRCIRTISSLKTVALIALFTGIPGLIFTFCRAPFLNFTVCTILSVGYAQRKKWISRKTIVCLMAATGIAFVLLWPGIAIRSSHDHKKGLEERINLIKIALNVIEDHPIIGIGINNYYDKYKAYVPHELKNTWVYAVHNQYLLIWAETGTLGFTIFMFFLISVVKRAFRCANAKSDLLAPVSLGFLFGFLAILLDWFWGLYVSEQATFHIYFFAGSIVAIEKLVLRQEQKENVRLAWETYRASGASRKS